MAKVFKIVIETYDIKSNRTETREEIKNILLEEPKHIEEVGLSQIGVILVENLKMLSKNSQMNFMNN
jgi:hypothetical protein